MEAKKNGKAGVIFTLQGTAPLYLSVFQQESCLGPLEFFLNLGVKTIQLTYSRRARTGDGCYELTDYGLSRSGVEVIEGMNKLGILLDLTHCGPRTTLEAIEVSKDPVAFTHGGAKGINDFARLTGDEEIHALAENGGVMGITAESNFIKYEGGLKENRATLEDYLDHIDYVSNLVGIDYVGIGSDIPEVGRRPERIDILRENALKSIEKNPESIKYPDIWYRKNTYYETMFAEGFKSLAETLNVTKGLIARGYSDQEIIKIQGGNFLKLFEKVWKND
jgi:membrane dipeptidase